MFRRPLLRRVLPWFDAFDGPLLVILGMLACAGLLTLYSAAYDYPGRVTDQARNSVRSSPSRVY